MASITRVKKKSGTAWRVQVHAAGRRVSAQFETKAEAKEWGLTREIELGKGVDLVGGKTLSDAFKRFSDELPRERKGKHWDQVRLKKFQTDPIAKIPAADLKLEDGEDFVTRSLAAGLSPGTVIREMNLMKPVVRKMVRWKWLAAYPWHELKMPAAPKRRSKLYTDAEIASILEHAKLVDDEPITTTTQQVAIAFIVATESGMRLNEICSLREEWWEREARVINLPVSATKTATARGVPLTTAASDALSRLAPRPGGRLFGVTAQTASTLFRRVRRSAGIHDGTFHDSRHYAVTKLSKKLDVLSLARVIGHSDIRELMTYYEADAAELAAKLD